MSTPAPHPSDSRAKRAAAEWLTKHDRGLTPVEQDEFFQWLAADSRHGFWFSRHRAGWHRLDRIAHWRPEHGKEPNPDVLARPVHRNRWGRPAFIAALAASLVLATAIVWESSSFTGSHSAVAVAGGGYERRVLDDGSVAELNHGAEIEIIFSAGERRVVLRRGEALFTVTKNPLRPFIVRAGGVDVRAVGTAFNVRLEESAVEVLVTEGKVQVAPSEPASPVAAGSSLSEATTPIVVAGERALVSLTATHSPQIARTTPAEFARLQSWQPQLLDFSSVPLSQVLAELNRRNRVQLILAAPDRAGTPIVASIRSDNIDGFVSLVAAAAGLRAERRGDYEIVLHAAR
ncbi:MAG: FecR domain-containing protein [Opitutaceae bacterium]|nr:FecR domain-containing protein [Opitutaceae bacterium]